MANASWQVKCDVTEPNGSSRTEAVYLSSPDLVDTNEAKRRAMAKAEERLSRRLRRLWGESGHLVTVRAVSVLCVG